MPQSMTGFGRSELKNDKYEISVEIRTLNNRYLDIGLKLPKLLNSYEYMVKELIKKRILRGKVMATVNFKNLDLSNGDYRINEDTIRFYMSLLEGLKKQTGINDKIKLDHILQFKELVEPEDTTVKDTGIESLLRHVFTMALDELSKMRVKEAENLIVDIQTRIAEIEKVLKHITERAGSSSRNELKKLYARLQDKIMNKEIDQERLELELAIIADRVDISEECARLASHLDLFRNVLHNKQEVGKQLTFILQEMHREANTIGSKTNDIKISHEMIKLKEEIEKLREQVQNLE